MQSTFYISQLNIPVSPDAILLNSEACLVIDLNLARKLIKELGISLANGIYKPLFLILFKSDNEIHVLYEMSYAKVEDKPVIHQYSLPISQYPTELARWLDKEGFTPNCINDGKNEAALNHFNINDVIHIKTQVGIEYLSIAIKNTIAFFDKIWIPRGMENPQTSLFHQFFNHIDKANIPLLIGALSQAKTVFLCLFPDAMRDLELSLAATGQTLANLRYVKQKDIIKQVYAARCEGIPDALWYVDKGNIDREMAEIAINCHAKALAYLPPRFLNEEIFDYALKQTAQAVIYIPDNKLTEKHCIQAVKGDVSILKDIPQKFLNKAVFVAAASASSSFFYFVPYHLKSYDVCKAAVMTEGNSMLWVPAPHIKPLRNELNIS